MKENKINITRWFLFSVSWTSLTLFLRSSLPVLVEIIVGAFDKTFRATGISGLFPKTLTIIGVIQEEHAIRFIDTHITTETQTSSKSELFFSRSALLTLLK
jgi:hypothetical protein